MWMILIWLSAPWIDLRQGDKRRRQSIFLREAHSALWFSQLSLEERVPGSISHQMWKINSGSQLHWVITLSLWWGKGTRLSQLHALMPLLFCWRKNQYLTQRTNLASPETALPSCPLKEDISCRSWPRTVMAAGSPWIFSVGKDYFCIRVHTRYLLFPPSLDAMYPSPSWTKIPSQWIALEFIPNQPRGSGWSPERRGIPRF